MLAASHHRLQHFTQHGLVACSALGLLPVQHTGGEHACQSIATGAHYPVAQGAQTPLHDIHGMAGNAKVVTQHESECLK